VMQGSYAAGWTTGGGVATWAEGEMDGFMIQAFDDEGNPIGNKIPIVTGGTVSRMDLQPQAGGGFFIAWSQALPGTVVDFEIFVSGLNPSTGLTGETKRQSWTMGGADAPKLVKKDAGWAILWVADTEQGGKSCLKPYCNTDLYLTLMSDDGEPMTWPKLVTDDPNRCDRDLAVWTGDSFINAWTAIRPYREALFARKMACSAP